MIDGELGIDLNHTIHRGTDGHIAQADIGGMVEQHIAVDASEAPEVLVFEIGAIAVFIHLDGNLIVTLLEIAGDVELRGFHGTLRVTHLLAINPDIEGRHDTLEAQECLTFLPIGR